MSFEKQPNDHDHKRGILAIFGVPKMALGAPESKFYDHFSIQTGPQKATSGTKIGPLKRKNGPQKRPKRP